MIYIVDSVDKDRIEESKEAFGEWLKPIALRKAKIVYNFGLSECSRVKLSAVGLKKILIQLLDL